MPCRWREEHDCEVFDQQQADKAAAEGCSLQEDFATAVPDPVARMCASQACCEQASCASAQGEAGTALLQPVRWVTCISDALVPAKSAIIALACTGCLDFSSGISL